MTLVPPEFLICILRQSARYLLEFFHKPCRRNPKTVSAAQPGHYLVSISHLKESVIITFYFL